jgi:hypothetical protein
MESMIDPVIAADGHSYERSCIVHWLSKHRTSPKTNEILPHSMLTPNHALRTMIKDWQAQNNNVY